MKNFTNNEVSKAGEALKDDNLMQNMIKFSEVMEILTYWRESHLTPLNEAEKILNQYVSKIDKHAFIAKRIKRLNSIKKKLKRFSRMELKNMQDIGGIRVVLSNLNQVYTLQNKLLNQHKSHFYNDDRAINIDDYIKKPKDDGYRCLHMVGKFKNDVNKERKIELQIRTRLQHSWATTLEIIDIFTSQDLKSNQGLATYHKFLQQVSEQFAILEQLDNFDINNIEQSYNKYSETVLKNMGMLNQCKEISLFFNQKFGFKTFGETLEEYSTVLNNIQINNNNKNGYLLVRLNIKQNQIDTEFFEINKKDDALNQYSLYEQTLSQNKNWIIALISTNAVGGLKEAYPNYFADCKLFIQVIQMISLVYFTYSITNAMRMKPNLL